MRAYVSAPYQQIPVEDLEDFGVAPNTDVIGRDGRVLSQRQRDDILRKINRSK